jgi:hypothetical protein
VRAEFIRVQCELARLEDASPEERASARPLFVRDSALTVARRDELLGPLAALVNCAEWWFHRGFVSRVQLPVHAFLVYADLLAGARPRPEVRVTHIAERVADFLRCPRLDLVNQLSLSWRYIDREKAPTEKEVHDGMNRLTRLTVLDADSSYDGDWFCALLGRFELPALEVLSLTRNAITDTGVRDLLRTEHPKKLRRLLLRANPIGDDGALRLARLWPSGADDRLEYLGLRDTAIGTTGAGALVARFGTRVEL